MVIQIKFSPILTIKVGPSITTSTFSANENRINNRSTIENVIPLKSISQNLQITKEN